MASLLLSPPGDGGPVPPAVFPLLGQTSTPFMENFFGETSRTLGAFLPDLIWAIIILLVGWIVATVAAAIVKGILKRTNLDNRLVEMITGRDRDPERTQQIPIEQWVAATVYWVIIAFTLVAFLNALNLEIVSEPLNEFLQEIFQYLPRIGGAAILLGVAWAVATIVKILVTQGLSQFNLDDRLAQQMGEGERSPIVLNETIGNILYWFIFLLFVPLILSALDLPGLLAPVEALIDQFLQAIPRIVTAVIILVLGWLIARIVRDITTNLLRATRVDQLGARFGLSASEAQSGISLSELTGSIVYVLILIPTAVAALNELDIEAISEPAVNMLERILVVIPQILMAGVVLVAFYVLGRFIADLVTSVLRSIGFDNIFGILGLPELTTTTRSETVIGPEGQPEVRVEPAGKSPAEFVGLIALVGVVLFGAVTATEILEFDTLTDIVQAILRVSARVLSGLIVFAIGLYFANLAFRLIRNMGGGQANFLAQAARIAIITLVGAMSLQQMGVATDIVNLAFGLLLGALAVAIAIAFGLGGRDIANEQIREWLNAFKQRQ